MLRLCLPVTGCGHDAATAALSTNLATVKDRAGSITRCGVSTSTDKWSGGGLRVPAYLELSVIGRFYCPNHHTRRVGYGVSGRPVAVGSRHDERHLMVDPDPGVTTRFNDAGVDPAGRLLAGTTVLAGPPQTGKPT